MMFSISFAVKGTTVVNVIVNGLHWVAYGD